MTSATVDEDAGLNVVKDVGVSAAVRPCSTAAEEEASAGGLVAATTCLNVHVQRAADGDSCSSSSPSQTVNPPSPDVNRRVLASGGVAAPAGE